MGNGYRAAVLVALAVLLTLSLPATAAQTTTLEVVLYGPDNTTVERSAVVNVSWMESHLPVAGDGVTPYRFQGPTFVKTDLWNPAETLNLEKINETVKGTAIRDLVGLVGGMYSGDVIQVRASDGFRKRLNYTNIYAPPARQGTAILAWWNGRNGYAWPESMRLFFLADTSSNPNGWHVFGNEDMRRCIEPANWHFFNSDGVDYPSAAGLSVAKVARLEIFPGQRPVTVPGGFAIPTDTNGDGTCDDVNGNLGRDFADIILYFNQMGWIAENEPVALFDYNKNGTIDFADVIALFVGL